MLNFLKREADKTNTLNGAVTYASTMSDCLDFFATAGALRNASEDEIVTRFVKAFAENRDIALKTLFFARDVRGGLGERRSFRVVMRYLAENYPETVEKNIANIAEFGRYDDILMLMDTPSEKYAVAYIKETLDRDINAMNEGESVSLMAKWLPSVNTSNGDSVRLGKKIAKALHMSDRDYRKMLSALRSHIRIIENNLREKDYTFDYEKQPSRALFKYRRAFIRNDNERYLSFIQRAKEDPSILHTGTLAPHEIVAPVLRRAKISASDREVMDTTWNALPDYAGSSNSLVVVDGSGSMYWSWGNARPIEVAESLGIYFAEHNKGAFGGHFITFSANPRLVEIKGRDIFEKVQYCMGFNECSNTDLKKTFDLILNTAVKNRLKQSDMPERLYIISDMEFDICAGNSNSTVFEDAKARFAKHGYKLPQVVFWNVNSINRQQPVRMNEQGVVLVSGQSPQVFSMIEGGEVDPYSFMLSIVSAERYERVAA